MHNDLVELGWTEDHWNRISGAVTEEAQKARIAAQMLPMVGPEDASTIAVPEFTLGIDGNPYPFPGQPPPPEDPLAGDEPQRPLERLTVNSNPSLFLTTIAVNVPLRSHEAADSNLSAALGMFRRAANYVARIEDALVFNGRPQNRPPQYGLGNIPRVFTVTGDGTPRGLVRPIGVDRPEGPPGRQRVLQRIVAEGGQIIGNDVVTAIIEAIGELDAQGHQGPYACALSQDLFALICTPNQNLILPRDRILPFLQGPLLRAAALRNPYGIVVALSGNPVELVVGSDIGVRYLQTTLEPRYMFRVSERVALRIREESAIAVLT